MSLLLGFDSAHLHGWYLCHSLDGGDRSLMPYQCCWAALKANHVEMINVSQREIYRPSIYLSKWHLCLSMGQSLFTLV